MPYFLVILTSLFFSVSLIAQDKTTISGYVRDAASGEALIGAVVQIKGTQNATSTNSYGYYALQISEPNTELLVSFVGYQFLEQTILISENKRYNFELVSLDNQLEEVVVSAKKQNDNVTNAQMGAFNFTMEEVKNIPVVFGERDILKTIQLLPGIGKGGEGSSNFYVRGGGADQNLILLDEATVY